jgi:hypothetical protein
MKTQLTGMPECKVFDKKNLQHNCIDFSHCDDFSLQFALNDKLNMEKESGERQPGDDKRRAVEVLSRLLLTSC